MKTKRNVLLVNTLISIGLAAAIFVIIGVVFDASCNGNLQMTNYSFSKMAAGVLATGLGFGLPTVIYGNENISLPIQTLIHMGIGCVVMIITAFLVGWIPTEKGALAIIVTIVVEIVIAFAIWLFFYAHQKRLAKKMNKRISERNQ
jgi:O-antigen/teichoic acid export membrane protein